MALGSEVSKMSTGFKTVLKLCKMQHPDGGEDRGFVLFGDGRVQCGLGVVTACRWSLLT